MAENDEPDETEAAQGDDLAGPREPWDRMRQESERAYAAFKAWLGSEKRSLTEVAQSSKFQCSVANLSRWSRMHDWRGRALAFDVRREQEEREQLARDRAAMRRRHLRLALALQSVAAHGIAEWQARIEQRLPLGLSAEECKSLMAEGVKLERLTLGAEDVGAKFTEIVVNLGDYADEPAYEAALSGCEEGEPCGPNDLSATGIGVTSR